ncbi:MAG: outer membrane beta-barrel protein [Candidatus Aminicenantes bacterium]|nr:outer membrane beta-barrel protein [Candidatus Aminicenantes bacterium]
MKPMSRFLLFSCFLFLFIPTAAYPSGMSLGFRLYGGLHSIAGGDLNSGLSGLSRLLEIQAGQAGMSVDGSFQDVSWSLTGGLDLILQFTPWLGLEIGGGYCQASRESVVRYNGAPDAGQWTIKPTAAAFPVRAGLTLLVPLGSGLSLSAHGGAAYFLASAKTSFRLESEATGQWSQETQDTTARGIGWYGGVGLEIRISRGLFFLIEAQGRLARIDGFEGDLSASNSLGAEDNRSGTLYHFRVNLPPGYSESGVNLLYIFETAPAGGGLTDVRPAQVDFGGFGAAVGLMIRL